MIRIVLDRIHKKILSFVWFLIYYTLRPAIKFMFRIRLFGENNLPRNENFLLAANHFGTLDFIFIPYAAISLKKPIRGMAKAELYDNLITRAIFSFFKAVYVKRGKSDTRAIEDAIQVVREGYIFGIAPEGTRQPNAELGRFHTGAARIALATGKPIVPLYIAESYEVLKKGKLFPNFVKVMIYIGEPIRVEQYGERDDRKSASEITEKVKDSITRMHERYEKEKRAYLVQRNLVDLDVRGVFATEGF
jgi:1-acyl-sn-glycerol-3-phosphate acyltransferase